MGIYHRSYTQVEEEGVTHSVVVREKIFVLLYVCDCSMARGLGISVYLLLP